MKAIRAQHGDKAPYLVVVTASGEHRSVFMKNLLTLPLAMPGDRERFLESGFDAYLSKPIQIPDLTNIIKHAHAHIKGSPATRGS
jgi:CheY-like chemotaxis protein